MKTTYEREASDRIVKVRPFEMVAGLWPQSGIGFVLDERGFPLRIQSGIAIPPGDTSPAASPLLERTIQYSPNGALQATSAPGGEVWTFRQNGYDKTIARMAPTLDVARIVLDPAGFPTRRLWQTGNGGGNVLGNPFPALGNSALTGFTEDRFDELGRLRRRHQGLFQPTEPVQPVTSLSVAVSTSAPVVAAGPAPGGGQPIPPAPDYLSPYADLDPEDSDLNAPAFNQTLFGSEESGWGLQGRLTNDLTYDAFNQATRLLDSDGAPHWIRRDSDSQPLEQSDGDGVILPNREYLRTTISRVVGTSPNQKVYLYRVEYRPDGVVKRIIDGAGHTTRFYCDNDGTLLKITDAMGPLSSTDKFPDGVQVNQDGNATTYTPDGSGGMVMKLALSQGGTAGGPPDTTKYNMTGALTVIHKRLVGGWSVVDGDGYLSTPASGPAVWVDAPNQIEWGYEADTGRRSSVTFKDGQGRCPDSTANVKFDDKSGRVLYSQDPNGTRLYYTYENNRLKSIGVTDATGTSYRAAGIEGSVGYQFQYEVDGSNATDLTTLRVNGVKYDSTTQARAAIQGAHTVGYLYPSPNRVVQYSGGGTATYTYDKKTKQLISVTDENGVGVVWSYFPNTQFDQYQFANNVRVSVTSRNGAGVATDTTIEGVGSSGTLTFHLARDGMRRINSRQRTTNAIKELKTWSYDSAGRLIQEIFLPDPASQTVSVTSGRTFDAISVVREENRAIQSKGSDFRSQNCQERGRIVSRDQMLLGVNQHYDYVHDKNGNLTSDGQFTYFYDAWNRLVRVQSSSGTVVSYTYDSVNRLVTRTRNSVTEEYVYDGWNLIEVYEVGTAQRKERYIWGDQGELLIADLPSGRYFVVHTPEGFVDAMVDSTGAIAEAYEYSISGEVLAVTENRTPIASPKWVARFLYHDAYYDPATDLYCYGCRWYHSDLGQFLTPDPDGWNAGPNHYGFQGQDPVNLADHEEVAAAARMAAVKAVPIHQQNLIRPDGPGLWESGGSEIAFGIGSIVMGFLIISNPVGWFVGLTGALMIASGIATTGLGVGHAIAASDLSPEDNRKIGHVGNIMLAQGSPVGFVGAIGGYIYYGGDLEHVDKAANLCALCEGGITLAHSTYSLARGELEFSEMLRLENERRRAGVDALGRANSRIKPINLRKFDQKLKDVIWEYFEKDPAARRRMNPVLASGRARGFEYMELSHMLPQRWGRTRIGRYLGLDRLLNRPWNLKPLWGTEHAMVDAYRYMRLPPAARARYASEFRDLFTLSSARRNFDVAARVYEEFAATRSVPFWMATEWTGRFGRLMTDDILTMVRGGSRTAQSGFLWEHSDDPPEPLFPPEHPK